MKPKNFLISSNGRSGTMFLSTIMNKSKKWEVNHEPRGEYEENLYKTGNSVDKKIIKDFEKDYYGEVNSRLRFFFNDINTYKKGIIFREPKDIITSVVNRNKNPNEVIRIINEVNIFWLKFKEWLEINPKILKIEFNLMVKDATYLSNVLDFFEIDDVKIDNTLLTTKINQNPQIEFKTFQDIPNEYKQEYKKLKWE